MDIIEVFENRNAAISLPYPPKSVSKLPKGEYFLINSMRIMKTSQGDKLVATLQGDNSVLYEVTEVTLPDYYCQKISPERLKKIQPKTLQLAFMGMEPLASDPTKPCIKIHLKPTNEHLASSSSIPSVPSTSMQQPGDSGIPNDDVVSVTEEILEPLIEISEDAYDVYYRTRIPDFEKTMRKILIIALTDLPNNTQRESAKPPIQHVEGFVTKAKKRVAELTDDDMNRIDSIVEITMNTQNDLNQIIASGEAERKRKRVE